MERIRIDHKKMSFLVILLCGLGIFGQNQINADLVAAEKGQSDTLEKVLEGSAKYCDKLAAAALDFVCVERIEETEQSEHRKSYPGSPETWSPSSNPETGSRVMKPSSTQIVTKSYRQNRQPQKVKNNSYVYDYQLIKKGSEIEEKRILLEENGKKKAEPDADLKTKRFYSKRSVFGPIGLLGRSRQDKFQYIMLDEDRIEGRDTFVIEVKPLEGIEEPVNYGKVWIDKEDYSVLKIEVDQESIMGLDSTKNKNIVHTVKDVHHYGVQKNGLRFPSRTVFEESYKAKAARQIVSRSADALDNRGFLWIKTEISYGDYRFFTVDVDVKY